MFKSNGSAKVTFAEPLITIHLFKPYMFGCVLKKEKKKKLKLKLPYKFLNALTDTNIKYNENIKLINSETIVSNLANIENKLPQTIQYGSDYDNSSNQKISNIEIINKKPNGIEVPWDFAFKDIEDKNEQIYVKKNSKLISHSNCKLRPNRRISKLMDLVLVKNIKSERTDNEGNSLNNLTEHTAGNTLSSIDSQHDVLTTNQKLQFTKKINVREDLMPLHVTSLLNKDKIETLENKKTDNLIPKIDNMFLQQIDYTIFRVNDEDTNNHGSSIINVPSKQNNDNVYSVGDKNFFKCPVISKIFSQESNDQNENSIDFNEEDEFIFEIEDFNKLNQSTNVLHSTVDELKVNSLEVRKRLRDIVCQRIRRVKKPKLNENLESNGILLYKSENTNDGSDISSSTKYNKDEYADRYININYSTSNSPSDLNSLFSRANGNMCNSNADLQNLFCDNDETIMLDNLNVSLHEPNTDKLPLLVKNSDTLELNSKSIQFCHILKKNSDFYNKSTYFSDKDNIISANKIESIDKTTPYSDDVENGYVFSRSFKDTNKFRLGKKSKKDYFYGISYHLNNTDQLIYKDLINRFGDSSAVFAFLMENKRLLYSRQLVLSDNCESLLANCINKHLNTLALYGYHNDNNVSKSFISSSYPVTKLYSKKLLLDIPDETNDTDNDDVAGDNDNNIFLLPLSPTSLNVSSTTSINLVNSASCIPQDKNHSTTLTFTMSMPIVSSKIHFPVTSSQSSTAFRQLPSPTNLRKLPQPTVLGKLPLSSKQSLPYLLQSNYHF